MARVLIITGDNFEDLEVFYPFYRLREEGFEVHIASNKDIITGKHGYTIKAHKKFKDVNPEEYDGLVIPGGRAPEKIRLDQNVLRITKHFFEVNKPVAAICHGPQVLISAGVIRGRKVTCYYGIKDDVIVAGAIWFDKDVVVDGNLVTSRYPDDLPAWMREFIKLVKGRK